MLVRKLADCGYSICGYSQFADSAQPQAPESCQRLVSAFNTDAGLISGVLAQPGDRDQS